MEFAVAFHLDIDLVSDAPPQIRFGGIKIDNC